MKTKYLLPLGFIILHSAFCLPAFAQGSSINSFTYQGRLNDTNGPVNGLYDFSFSLFDNSSFGNQIGTTVMRQFLPVTNGLFTVPLDFPGANNFPGPDRWLEITVKPSGGAGTNVTLSPRQQITAAPYAIRAASANSATMAEVVTGSVSASQIVGTIGAANLDPAIGLWTTSGSNVFRPTGGVGIGTANPNGAALAVNGFVTVEGIVYANGLSAASVTTPGVITEKVRTAGNVPMEFSVNGQRGLRIEPTATADTVNVIGGSARNFVSEGVVGATIGGGGSGDYGFGARTNRVDGDFGTVSGGFENVIQTYAIASTIGGGNYNTIQPNVFNGTIGGGWVNMIQASAEYATIGGGDRNIIHGYADRATIGGGLLNTIQSNAFAATIPGGRQNSAADFAFAAGNQAKANHRGAFVWADSTFADFASTANDQFAIRATGGVVLSDNTPNLSFGSQSRQMLNLFGTSYGIGVQSSSLYFRCDNAAGTDGFIWYKGGVHHSGYAQPGAGGVELMHLVAGGLYVNGAIVLTSDRHAKENFKPVSPREVLEKVAALPLTEWNYKTDASMRHIGPMAQDFYAAFNVGPDDKHIATVDADGVALAAIQGLNEKVEDRSRKAEGSIRELRAENAELKQSVNELKVLLQAMNQKNRGAQ